MLSKNVVGWNQTPSYVRKKKQDSFCDGITAWRICFVAIVVSCDFFVLLCSELIFLYCLISSVYHCWWWMKLVIFHC